jgi:2-polyprenyl-3-methyl-5-hydroxy-6-metoxy-1,4-benzoquinol methylase
MPNDKLPVICPACKNTHHFSPSFSFPEFKLITCESCGLIFIPASDYLPPDYYEHYKDAATAVEVAKSNPELKRLVNLDRYHWLVKFKPSGKVLDVGAGWGHFVWAGKETAFEVQGIEPSKENAEFAVTYLGAAVRHGSFYSMTERDEFDVVTMWDVLEHINDPISFVQQTNRVLKPGGIVVIKVPDASSFSARFFGKNWYNIGHEHVNLFGKKNLSSLLEREGFQVIKISLTVEPKNLLLYSVLPKIKRLLPKKPQASKPSATAAAQQDFNAMTSGGSLKTKAIWSVYYFMLKFSEWFRLGDEMVVVAKKV